MEPDHHQNGHAQWSDAATPETVANLRRAVADYSAAHGFADRVADIALALSEALTNAVVHGNRGERAGTLTVAAKASATRLRITVLDDGIGLTPRPDSPGAGLGLPIIAHLADDLTIRPGPEGNGVAVAMTFDRGR